MRLNPAAGAGLLLCLVPRFASAAEVEQRQTQTAKYCAADGVCYSEFVAPTSNISYRIAIPDTSTSAPFDIYLQITAPSAVGWAGLAWGGAMAKNPLTVAWPNGDSVVVSSRWATGHTLPGAYAGATYTVLRSSKDAATWQIELLCTGCSSWEGAALNPNGSNTFAWAMSSRPATNPASNTSGFPAHTAKNKFDHDLRVAKIPVAQFSALARSSGAPASTTGAASTSLLSSVLPTTATATLSPTTPSVVTGVTTLPKPAPSSPSASSNKTTLIVVSTGVTTLPRPTAKTTTPSTSITPIQSTPVSTETVPFDPPIPTTTYTVSRVPDSPWTQPAPTLKSSTVVPVPIPTPPGPSSVRPEPVWPSPGHPRPPWGNGPPHGRRPPPWRHHPP